MQKHEKKGIRTDNIRENRPCLFVALVGECSCGKSTFLNNIIGERFLSTDLLVTTAIPTYIRWDGHGKPEMTIQGNNGDVYGLDGVGREKIRRDFHVQLPQQMEEAVDFITTNNQLSGKIKKVEIHFREQKRYDSICMIDTPGVNPGQEGTEQHVMETQRVIMEEADMAIILFPATKVMTKSFTDFLEKYSAHLMQDAVFVITQMDLVPTVRERDKILRFVKDRIEKTFNLAEPLVYGSSAEMSLRYKNDSGLDKEEEMRWSERFDHMWDEILEHFNARKIRMLFKNMDTDVKGKIELLSQMAVGETADYNICWDMEARRIAQTISRVEAIAAAMELPGMTSVFRNDLDALVSQCRTAEFQIAIVGVMKAGKSMLMNALMGAEIASVDINPETASLTKFRSISSGFHIKIRFHSGEEWNRLCASARESSGGKLREMIELPATERLAEKWVDHKEIIIYCESVEEVREKVAHWTSARSNDHLFAAEVEVGIDRSIFDMPDEVVFVDTPGLHDPVRYRSDITKDYIKRANAVLITVPTAALTAEGLGTITTVLDHVGSNKEKACIVATKRDTLSDRDCDKVMKGWVEHLVSAKRYKDEADARAHMVVTSGYMHIQLHKFLNLKEEEVDDPEKFSDVEYAELESYAKRTLGRRRFQVEALRNNEEDAGELEKNCGILRLHRYLEKKLLTRYRELKKMDIEEEYLRCRKELLAISQTVKHNQSVMLESAQKGAGELKKRLEESSRFYEEAKIKNDQIRKAAEDVKRISASLINSL